MSLKRRGNSKIWHFEFQFDGVRVQRSTKTTSKVKALEIERTVRVALEQGQPGATVRKVQSVGVTAALDGYIERSTVHWQPNTLKGAQNSYKALTKHFGNGSTAKITGAAVSAYQTMRRASGVCGRTVNLEVALLRKAMGTKQWAINVGDDYKNLKERSDVGSALDNDQMIALLNACKASPSAQLYPAVLASIHTGLRSSELRNLRWSQINFDEPSLTVGKSKTKAGEGRKVYLSQEAVAVLKEWQAQFAWCKPEHFVFPHCEIRFNSLRQLERVSYDPTVPMSSFRSSWMTAKKLANVECRWHDLRHTFVSMISETGTSDATVMELAGHVSKRMLERYSHSRNNAKKLAIETAFGGQTLQKTLQNV